MVRAMHTILILFSFVFCARAEQKVALTSQITPLDRPFLLSSETNHHKTLVQKTHIKGGWSQFLLGKTIETRIDSIQNSDIPFLAKSNGFKSEFSTERAKILASYFKSASVTGAGTGLKKDKKISQSGDTKLGIAIPFFTDIHFFGGYSYRRNEDEKLTKGPSFGFQADLAKYIKLDTTFIKQRQGRSSANVLLSLSMDFNSVAKLIKNIY